MKALGPVVAAAITPRKAGEADVGATLELIDWLCAAGVGGIAVLGPTGEFVNLAFDERVRLLYLATKRSRVPVLAGISHASLDGALELAREACSAGAAGLLLMPPFFFRYDQEDIREFYTQFAAQVGVSASTYLQNLPAFGSGIAVETALELLSTGRFAGIADASGSLADLQRFADSGARAQFSLLAGDDSIACGALQAGADGIVSALACAMPELLVALHGAVRAEARERMEALDARVREFLAWSVRFPAPVAIKTAARLRGLKTGELAVPLSSRKQALLEEFQEWFRAWLPGVRKECAHA